MAELKSLRKKRSIKVGAWIGENSSCTFTVWAPDADIVDLVAVETRQFYPMERNSRGYWTLTRENIPEGFLYQYRLDKKNRRPDPASQHQPQGVHGPSAVVDHSLFRWNDLSWKGIRIEDACIYELHVGTFTDEGTFDAVIGRLEHLCVLGVTAVEIMPVAHFPGERNWGYDGVHPFAAHTAYGGVNGLKRLVDACHRKGLAVILDVVYNHLGPEGNYIWEYGHYFTQDKYKTPWGWAVNYDDAGSDDVRSYFIANALYWMEYVHIDGLRLDAVHTIFDRSARPFLEQLQDAVTVFEKEAGIARFLIAESDMNDPRFITSKKKGGMGLTAQWSDDLHHALHAVLTGERHGYYQDFGTLELVAAALEKGYAYTGQYSRFRKRSFGRAPEGVPCSAFVVCSQNHDQVGNRMLGERLISIAGPKAARLAAAAVILSPMLPLLFMGEEWGETNPFMYFVDHGDEALCKAVREGRKKEFEAFHTEGEAPDPTGMQPFTASKIDWSKLTADSGSVMFAFYRECIRLKKLFQMSQTCTFDRVETAIDDQEGKILSACFDTPQYTLCAGMNFHKAAGKVRLPFEGAWQQVLSSNAVQWGGDDDDGFTEGRTTTYVPPECYRLWVHEKKGKQTG